MKRSVRIVLFIIILLFLMVLAEMGFRKVWHSSWDTNLNEKPVEMNGKIKQGEHFYWKEDKMELQTKHFVGNMIEAIKDKDYRYVAKFLNPSFYAYMFQSKVKNLQEYIEKNILPIEEYRIDSVVLNGGLFQNRVIISNGKEEKLHVFTVRVIDESNCQWMLGEYRLFHEINYTQYQSNDLLYRVSYYAQTNSVQEYIVDITNDSGKSITIEFPEQPLIANGTGMELRGHQLETITIPPKGTVRVTLAFSVYLRNPIIVTLPVKENGESQRHIINVEDL